MGGENPRAYHSICPFPQTSPEEDSGLLPLAEPLTDGADDAGVPGRDWLLVDVQQTEVLQESVGHAGVQPLPLDEGVF